MQTKEFFSPVTLHDVSWFHRHIIQTKLVLPFSSFDNILKSLSSLTWIFMPSKPTFVYSMIVNSVKAAIYVHGQWTMSLNPKITRNRTLRESLLPKRHKIFGIFTKGFRRLDPSGCLCPTACAINGNRHISAI